MALSLYRPDSTCPGGPLTLETIFAAGMKKAPRPIDGAL